MTIHTSHPSQLDTATRGISPTPGVLFIGNFLSHIRGTRSVCEDLADRLDGRHWNVLRTSHQPGRVRRIVDMLWTIAAQRRLYVCAHVDVYSGPAFRWAEAACWALRRLHQPYILTLHGGNLPEFSRRHPRRVRRLLSSAAFVTAPSNYLIEHLRPFRSDISLIPNPVDLQHCRHRSRDQATPRLVWLRAFHAVYNPLLLCQAVAELTAFLPNVECVMIGPDKKDGTREAVLAFVNRNGLQRHVVIRDAIDKALVPKALDQADVFVNTTNFDNTPVCVVEAMACGLCVVSTNVGGIPHLLEHGRNALLVPPRNPAALTAAVRQVIADRDLASSLSREGRKTAEAWDWSQVLPLWEQCLHACGAQRSV